MHHRVCNIHRAVRSPWWPAGAAASLLCGLLTGCGGGGGAASPTLPTGSSAATQQLLDTVTGAYALEVTPSGACNHPPVTLRWDVQATQGQERVRLTLVGGDASVDMSLYPAFSLSTPSGNAIDGSLRTSVWVGDWDVSIIGGRLGGTISRGPGGRAEVRDGILDANIWIEDYVGPGYSCTAANHRWTLTPR